MILKSTSSGSTCRHDSRVKQTKWQNTVQCGALKALYPESFFPGKSNFKWSAHVSLTFRPFLEIHNKAFLDQCTRKAELCSLHHVLKT